MSLENLFPTEEKNGLKILQFLKKEKEKKPQSTGLYYPAVSKEKNASA